MSSSDMSKNVYDKLTLGIIKSLEKRSGVCDIKLAEKLPVDRSAIVTWEQKFSCIMPDDLRSFYLTSNGLSLKWNVKMNDSRIPVGRLEINTIEKVVRIGYTGSLCESTAPSLGDLDLANDLADLGPDKDTPKFDQRSRIFELDACDGYGKVCYVFRDTKPGIPAQNAEVWFLDRSLQWHPLADSFITYYRILLMHLGLPQWQYAFTDVGLSPQAKQWFEMYSPMRMGLDGCLYDSPPDGSALSPTGTTVDIARVFKGKLDKKKPLATLQNIKKRQPPVSSAKPGSGRTLPTNSQINRPLR